MLAYKSPLPDSIESVRHSQQVRVYKFLVSNLSRCGDQRQHGIGHDSDYPHAKPHPGDTFAAVQDDSSTTFSTAGARGQDSSSETMVIQRSETDLDFLFDLPDLPALEPSNAELLDRNTALPMPQSFQLDHYDEHQIFMDEGATGLYLNNPTLPDHT